MTQTYGPQNLTVDQMHSVRNDAIKAAHSHYFTGKPCKYGHVFPRKVSNRRCVECLRLYSKEYSRAVNKKAYEQNPQKYIDKANRYYSKNRERILEQRRAYRAKNKDEISEQNRRYYLKKKQDKEQAESE